MKLPELAIKNYQFTIVVTLLIALVGIVTFITMPRSEDPQNEMAGTVITVIYPGATPEDLEKLVIDPIEEKLNELDDIKKMESKAFDGVAAVTIEFTTGSDPEDKYRKVLEAMNVVEKDLPEEIFEIDKQKFTVMDVSILQLALVTDSVDYTVLEDQAENLKRVIEKSYGVRNVEIMANPEREVRVSVDFERMAQLGVSMQQLTSAIQSNNVNVPGGSIDIGYKKYNILTSGEYENLDEIKNTVVHQAMGQVIRLKDLANVEFAYEDNKYLARYNGRKAVFVNVTQKKNTNIYRIDEKLQPKIEAFQHELPESVELKTVLNQAEAVRFRVGDFFMNFFQGIILVGFFILIAIGVRASFIVMTAIPVSVLIGLTLLDLSNYGLQQMSIAGLIIALGLLVDNSIAVVENIHRYIDLGYSRKDAAIKGTKEIGWALVSSTVTTVLAFVPMISIGGPTGDFIRSMAVVVVYTLIASLVIALTFTPYFASVILKIKEKSKNRQSIVTRIIHNVYPKLLGAALKRPWLTIGLTILIFAGSLSLFGLIGVSFFPKAQKAQLLINIETPEGSSFQKTDKVVRNVEALLNQEEFVTHYASNIGHGNPQVYYNENPISYSVTTGQIFVTLKEYDADVIDPLVEKLRAQFGRYPGADIEVKEFIQGPPVEAPIAIKVTGNDLNTLRKVSADVEEIIATTPLAFNVDNPLKSTKTDVKVKIDPVKAGVFGVNLLDVDMAVKTNISGTAIGKYRDPEGEEYDMVLRMPDVSGQSMHSFDKIYVANAMGAQVPLKQVANIELESSLKQVSHYNMDRQNTITADVTDLGLAASITNTIIDKLDQYPFPAGFGYFVGGQLESQEESFGDMGRVLLLALIGIFAILVLQFKSFTQPLIIYSAIPLAVTGAFVALFITGYSFSFMAFVGLTSLIGIVVNDSIILVDFTNQLRQQGKEKTISIIEAGQTRFMPIILTTVTTIGGLLPLTLRGGDMWAPMGWAIIGGLLFATLLSLIIVPVLYKVFSKKDGNS
ncbi:efflux RND transporter permease subunit [Fulvivirgaceae bacterium BMA10]|uniref:Efflux RND transporter permease subunit n=1 Tax=Splendidivirga corallicola TaxID=3051826 RepID=A0ABT8KGG1_9BACT|nr:efflux RND transporter permease subunit [Fulvivirgaceae bacterium BMA10]